MMRVEPRLGFPAEECQPVSFHGRELLLLGGQKPGSVVACSSSTSTIPMSWKSRFWFNAICQYILTCGALVFGILAFTKGGWVIGTLLVLPWTFATVFLLLIKIGKIKPKEKWARLFDTGGHDW